MTTVAPTRSVGRRVEAASRTTPGRYRLWSLAAAAVLVVATVTATASATRMRSSTHRARDDSGPVLVATQQLVSSLAEADAAASAAFLSGRNEDPEQRRLYEQALARSGQQVEDIAALAGRDQAVRDILRRISVQLTQYAGLVEAARASNKSGTADANGYLVSAVSLAGGLVQGDVKALTDRTQSNLGHDEDDRRAGFYVGILVLVVALALLVAGQATLTRTSRRVVNPPLALATVLTLVAAGWLVRADQTSGNALAAARKDGYDSIVLTTQLASAGFGAKAADTLAVITGDAAQRSAADAEAQLVANTPVSASVADSIRQGRAGGAPGGLLGQAATAADTPRERAAVAEAAERWQRYENTVVTLRAAPNQVAATAIAVGQASSDFNGFNFSVESILGQNRGQFLDGLATAADRTTRLPTGVLLLLLAALATALWGFQLRINDYRMESAMTPQDLMSRRTFLGGAAALALGAAACSRGGLKAAPTGDAGKNTGRLKVLNWQLYIDTDAPGQPGTVARFEQATGTKVDYSEAYNDNRYGQDKVFGPTLEKGKPTGFDVIVPTYWLVADLLSRDLLNEIPLERIPNHVNLDPALLGTSWDQGARFQLPWQAGFTGIAYNPALTRKEIKSFADLLDPSLKGKVGMVTEMREVLGFFMLANGQDPSRATVANADAALDRLEALVGSGQVLKFTGNEYVDSIKNGEFAACLAWSGGVLGLQTERPDIKFVFPAEGGMRWFDSMIIPKGATNVAAAGDWMNFVYDPANAAKITAAVGYVSPVMGVKDVLAKAGGDAAKLAASPVLFPDDATRRRLYFWSGTTPAEEAALQARFTKITGV